MATTKAKVHRFIIVTRCLHVWPRGVSRRLAVRTREGRRPLRRMRGHAHKAAKRCQFSDLWQSFDSSIVVSSSCCYSGKR